MTFRIMNLLLLLGFGCFAGAQQLPIEGARLNYTQIMFEHGKVYGAGEYVVQVAIEQYDGAFKNIVAEHTDSSVAVMISNFEFGKKYIWRYAGLHDGKKMEWKGPYHFEILSDIYVDTNFSRLAVIQHDSGVINGLLTLDVARTIADRNGNFVWFLPQDASTNTPEGEINDLRITSAGTLTFLKGRRAVETDLNGATLWMAPKDTEKVNPGKNSIPQPYNYNHCLARLANGDYMVQTKVNMAVSPLLAGISPSSPTGVPEGAPAQTPAGSPMSLPSSNLGAANNQGTSSVLQYDIIKEFNKKGNVVWSWNSNDYFSGDEVKIMLATRPDGGALAREAGGHLNAFCFDEKNGAVYAGFRNVSRVVKIDYKTGKTLNSWGPALVSAGTGEDNGFFSKQHDVSLLRDGSIAVFSNGSTPLPHIGMVKVPSRVVVFSQPSDSSASKVIWKFDCTFDSVIYHSTRGGNIHEMSNGNLLICMGTINRIFEITRNKRVLWQALMMKYVPGVSLWMPRSLYKVNFASSLYPCFFTVQTSADTLTKTEPSFDLRIFNDGTEDDSYAVKISSPNGSFKKQFTTAIVHSHKSEHLIMAPDELPKGNEKITVSVTSKANPDFERTEIIQFLSYSGKRKH